MENTLKNQMQESAALINLLPLSTFGLDHEIVNFLHGRLLSH